LFRYWKTRSSNEATLEAEGEVLEVEVAELKDAGLLMNGLNRRCWFCDVHAIWQLHTSQRAISSIRLRHCFFRKMYFIAGHKKKGCISAALRNVDFGTVKRIRLVIQFELNWNRLGKTRRVAVLTSWRPLRHFFNTFDSRFVQAHS